MKFTARFALLLGIALAFGSMTLRAADDPLHDSTIAAVSQAEADATKDAATEAVAEEKVSVVDVASEALKSPTAPGVGWLPSILAALTFLIALLTKLTPLIPPGWRTYSSLAGGVLAQLVSTIGDLSATGHVVTSAVVLGALVDAGINRWKSGKS